MPSLNPVFRHDRATAHLPERSPSPPRRFVEPLSPTRPKPIEPNFNYPPLNNHVDYAVRPEQAYAATPKARQRSSSYKHTHHRTPSTIDTLAEAALAVSPPYQQQSASARNGQPSTTYPTPSAYERSEPPHKRTRSEIFPTPMITPYASRPATSYEHSSGWYGQQQPAGSAYDSRAEEAALLLGLRQDVRTSSFASHSTRLPPPSTPGTGSAAVARPHANSFPQSAHHPRPHDYSAHAPLLPPFQSQQDEYYRPHLPSPQHTIPEAQPSPRAPIRDTKHRDQFLPAVQYDSPVQAGVTMVDAPQQTHPMTGEAQSRVRSTDVVMGDASDPAGTTKRGWSKGKARAASARKPAGERKTGMKRAANRKKTPDVSKTRRSASVTATDEWSTVGDAESRRRKSFSNGIAERPHLNSAFEERAKSVPVETPMIVRSTSPTKKPRPKPKINLETICAGCHTARETVYANAELDQWVSCNGCKKWFHVDCAGFKKATEVRDVDKYFCSACEPTHGKTTYVRKSTRAHTSVDYAELQRGVLKTSEESQEHHYIQPIKDGTFQFDPESFPRMRPELVTRDFFERSGTFVEPICIPAAWNPRPWLKKRQKSDEAGDLTNDDDLMNDLTPDEYEYDTVPDEGQDRLGMVMPEELTVRQVCNLVGPEVPLDVIDVKTQNSGAKWNLGRWADYYEEQSEDKPIRNVISLEVSQTKLGRLLKRPQVVRDIDLQDEVWPQKELDQGKWPKVQFYCLMSVADSYTDFHIDFGGSSVYYHILKGKKTFFFIPPKAKHLKAYEEWNDSHQQNYTFLPHITKECYRVDLSEGDTMLIPSGWIHAVWTPETSLVIGGNFLTRMSFKNQFKVVEIEKANETPMRFRYPFFQKLMWYTAINYMQKDPVPEAVSQMFYDGRRFVRQRPVWADFDGDIANEDGRPGAKNARYYSEAEMEGLPDLVNFIFRTVMLVQGRVEGISQDRMKRVNASIPKGHGEPLEVAKRFALWVAWKRGNENPPAWAHPDAVLPSSKEEGPPKKLSARALKELERKEAMAAGRSAGPRHRQSVRVQRRGAAAPADAAAEAAAKNAPSSHVTRTVATRTPERKSSDHHQQPTPPPPPPSARPPPHAHHHMLSHASAVPPPMAYAMNGYSSYISTPKTSVLGPKRVACDTCRKRRIKCKHKDFVQQATPDGVHLSPGAYGISPELHDHIAVTPPQPQTEAKHFTNYVETSQAINATANAAPMSGGPLPGTNAYIHANIPMAMNGVQMFGEANKRGRSKACFECRKSKRRCVHDESGNVDPIKAAETPVPRGSVASKKRTAEDGDEGTPTQSKKELKTISPVNGSNAPPPSNVAQQQQQQPPASNGNAQRTPPVETYHQYVAAPTGYHQQSPLPNIYQHHSPAPNGHHHDHHQTPVPNEHHQPSAAAQKITEPKTGSGAQTSQQSPRELQQSQTPIDPSLFAYSEASNHSAYPDPSSHPAYQPTNYPYPAAERPRLYQLPSLEQIASDVLNFEDNPEQDSQAQQQQHVAHSHVHVYNRSDLGAMPNGLPTSDAVKPDESVDSAISLPGSETSEHNSRHAETSESSGPLVSSQEQASSKTDIGSVAVHHGLPSAQPSLDTTAYISPSIEQGPSVARKGSVSALPLYQPPGPPSQSPEQVKRMPMVANGGAGSLSKGATSNKRKRTSTSHTPGPKRVKAGSDDLVDGKTAAEASSLELAKVLQQEDMGLRQRVN